MGFIFKYFHTYTHFIYKHGKDQALRLQSCAQFPSNECNLNQWDLQAALKKYTGCMFGEAEASVSMTLFVVADLRTPGTSGSANATKWAEKN